MSGLLCVYAAKDDPAVARAFRRMCEAAAYHGPEPCRRWTSGPITLGHVALRTTPESDLERQPTTTPDGRLCVILDGRLDNRGDLLGVLSIDGPSERVTDVDLVLAAYERWGEACVEHFVGDYAFSLWDARSQRLFCARDPLGIRPFYYARLGNAFYAASGLEELMRGGAIPNSVNEGMVAEYLTGKLHSTSDTLYQSVRRLPPGHRLTVDRRGIEVSRYWRPDLIPESTLSPVEAAECFCGLFEQAVRACARTNRPLAAQLSGGLDSSSVVSVLSELRNRGELQQSFEAFTMTFPGLECDESAYARAVALRHELSWNQVCTEPLPLVDYEELAARYCDFPGYPNGTFALQLARDARSKGIRVVLSGSGGDEWLDKAPASARSIDLLLSRQWRALRAEWRGSSASVEIEAAARQLLAHTFERIHFHAPKHILRRRRLPPWILPGFVHRTRLAERVSPPVPVPLDWSWSRAQRLHFGTNGACSHAMEMEARMYAHLQLEERHPFYDRRLVEFMISLPERYSERQDEGKWLLREAMRGTLPESVRTRRTKVHFAHTYQRSLATARARRMVSTFQGAHDWIDGAVAQRELTRFLSGDPGVSMFALWGTYGIHAWAQTLRG